MEDIVKLKISLPKKERTPKYYILSALYSMQAHKIAVETGQKANSRWQIFHYFIGQDYRRK